MQKRLANSQENQNRLAVVCFDDGCRSILETVAPFLERRRIPYIVSANGAFLEQKSISEDLLIHSIEQTLGTEKITKLFLEKGPQETLRQYSRRHLGARAVRAPIFAGWQGAARQTTLLGCQ